MQEKLVFLERKTKQDLLEKLFKDVAVVLISESIDTTHFLFEREHHSLDFHPEVNQYLKSTPTKHRHVTGTLKDEQLQKYRNLATKVFNLTE